MSVLPLADGARLLGIHPKTLRQWLKQDALELSSHPRDVRVKCLTLSPVHHLADLHGRPLQEQFQATPVVLEADQPNVRKGEHLSLCTTPDETDLLTKLASLETRVVALTEQVGHLALLEVRDRTSDHHLSTLAHRLGGSDRQVPLSVL